jgi:hypothetical protein
VLRLLPFRPVQQALTTQHAASRTASASYCMLNNKLPQGPSGLPCCACCRSGLYSRNYIYTACWLMQYLKVLLHCVH